MNKRCTYYVRRVLYLVHTHTLTINDRIFENHHSVDMNNDNKSRWRKPARRVHFSRIVIVRTIDDTDEDRHSEWMRYAIDRQRFKRRISILAPIIERILTVEHRTNIQNKDLKIATRASENV